MLLDEWFFLADDGSIYGPTRRSRLETMAAEGTLTDQRIRHISSDIWINVSEIDQWIQKVSSDTNSKSDDQGIANQPQAFPGVPVATAPRWYIYKDEQVLGPISFSDILDRVTAGEIDESTLVCRDDTSFGWLPFSKWNSPVKSEVVASRRGPAAYILLSFLSVACISLFLFFKYPHEPAKYYRDHSIAHGLILKKEYVQARFVLEQQGKGRSPEGDFLLGRIYAEGLGIEKNPVVARQYFQSSLDRNFVEAFVGLGITYFQDKNTIEDWMRAVDYFRKGVEKGCLDCQFWLAVAHRDGRGVKRDEAAALKHFLVAANKQHSLAQNEVGRMYLAGRGTPRDAAEAHEWFIKASARGNGYAMMNLAVLYADGIGVKQDKSQGETWIKKAVATDVAAAKTMLGLFYLEGKIVEKDIGQALEWLDRGAVAGDLDARNHLGLVYLRGAGVPADYVKARAYFTEAAEQGLLMAFSNLALMHLNGLGVERDPILAYAMAILGVTEAIPATVELRNRLKAQLSPFQVSEGEALAKSTRKGLPVRTGSSL
jgi:TPR repeat protein